MKNIIIKPISIIKIIKTKGKGNNNDKNIKNNI